MDWLSFFLLRRLLNLLFFVAENLFSTNNKSIEATKANPKPRRRRKRSAKSPISIVGSEYCTRDGVVFWFRREVENKKAYFLNVSDMDGKMNWDIKMYDPHKDDKFRVFDNEGKIFMTLKEEWQNFCARWKVYKGDTSDEKDLLFTVRKSNPLSKNDLDVYLPSTNEEGGECDFKVEANRFNRGFLFKQGDHTLAQGITIHNAVTTTLAPMDLYCVTVSPRVDYAFIVALTMLYDKIYTRSAFAFVGLGDISDTDTSVSHSDSH